MLGWVALGLWLRRVPFRSLFGVISARRARLRGRSGSCGGLLVRLHDGAGLHWPRVERSGVRRSAQGRSAQPEPDECSRASNRSRRLKLWSAWRPPAAWRSPPGLRSACWWARLRKPSFAAICSGSSPRGRAAALLLALPLSALMFGAAHGYEGARNMVLLAVFGALFSGLGTGAARSARGHSCAQRTRSFRRLAARFRANRIISFRNADSSAPHTRERIVATFSTPSFVFFLTLCMHKSIHSSTAIHVAASMQPIEKGE